MKRKGIIDKQIDKYVNKYKQMTKEEKMVLAKRIMIGTCIGVTGYMLGKALSKSEKDSEIKFLRDDIDCLFDECLELNEIIDRQAFKIKEYVDATIEQDNTIKNLKEQVEERDLSIMELVDGDENRYRGIRGAIWNHEELIENADRLDMETYKAKREYDKIRC